MEILFPLIYIAVAFVADVAFFTWHGDRRFNIPPVNQFASLREHRDFGVKQSVRCRDSHMFEAGAVGVTCGLIACYFMGVFFLPTVGSIVCLLSVWYIMTYEFRPELANDYIVKSNLLTAAGVATVLGIVVSLMAGAALLPVIVAMIIFWAAWLLLMPM